MIPAWHIALLASLYAAEYVRRAFEVKGKKYLYIGKALGRAILAGVYLYFSFIPTDAEIRTIWIRWSLEIFLLIDLLFALQERLMGRFIR
jgi:uncharacterized membrane protein